MTFAGFPLVDICARFLLPTRFGDDVTIETTMPDFRRSSFDLSHRLLKDGKVAVECSETRVWVVQDLHDAARIKATPVPPEVVARFARV